MIPHLPHALTLLTTILDRIHLGIVVVDQDMKIHYWNGFMETHSGRKSETLFGKNLLDCFPELSQKWFRKKIESVFLFENFAFSSWKNRPYLFRFQHTRPVTGNIDFMRQDCTFFPLKNNEGKVEYVCLALSDATDHFFCETQLNEALTSLEILSRVDGLTGLTNRAYFEKRLGEEFDRSKRYHEEFAFLMLDLDFFKRINDTYGHLAGDEVLREVAKKVAKEFRAIDIVGRYGGEEFAAFLPNTSLEGARIVAERIREIVETSRIVFEEQILSITVSIGVTHYRSNIPSYTGLIDEADQALYQSKQNGRNRVTCFSPSVSPSPSRISS